MSSSSSRRARFTRGRIVAGATAVIAAGIAVAATPASGATWGTSTGTQASQVTAIRHGAHGATTGAVLVKAGGALTTYWNRYAPSARVVTVAARPTQVSGAAPARMARPQGPSVRIGGTGGLVGSHVAASKIRHFFGSTGQPWYGNYWSAPATTTGKVFFTDHTGGHWVCSGSLVNSNGKDLVITAGHCVYGTAGGEIPAGETWHSNWVFAPDYSNGYAPFGYWYAKQLWTLTNYMNNDDEPDDLGAALLWPNSNGVNAVNWLGGQGMAWNQSSSQGIYDFGYPQAAPFNGQTLQYCTGTSGFGWFSNMEFLPSNFTGGSSGGPWLMNFNGTWGYVNSVNDATGYFFYPGQMGGLYFGNSAGNLYNTVANL